MLEEESKALADRLVRGQVSRAEEEETTFVVQRELDVLRHTHLETTHQLALANEKIRSLSLMMEETVSLHFCLNHSVYFCLTAYFETIFHRRNFLETRATSTKRGDDRMSSRRIS